MTTPRRPDFSGVYHPENRKPSLTPRPNFDPFSAMFVRFSVEFIDSSKHSASDRSIDTVHHTDFRRIKDLFPILPSHLIPPRNVGLEASLQTEESTQVLDGWPLESLFLIRGEVESRSNIGSPIKNIRLVAVLAGRLHMLMLTIQSLFINVDYIFYHIYLFSTLYAGLLFYQQVGNHFPV